MEEPPTEHERTGHYGGGQLVTAQVSQNQSVSAVEPCACAGEVPLFGCIGGCAKVLVMNLFPCGGFIHGSHMVRRWDVGMWGAALEGHDPRRMPPCICQSLSIHVHPSWLASQLVYGELMPIHARPPRVT
jgi:hypothetical protein